jgi:hypothetical protein
LLLRLTNLLETFQSLSLSLGKIITPAINITKIKAQAVILRAKEALKKNSETRVAPKRIGTILLTKLLAISSLRPLVKNPLILRKSLPQDRISVKAKALLTSGALLVGYLRSLSQRLRRREELLPQTTNGPPVKYLFLKKALLAFITLAIIVSSTISLPGCAPKKPAQKVLVKYPASTKLDKEEK